MKKIEPTTLMEHGVHYGYSRTRRHPTVSNFIYGNKNGVDIIDAEKTIAQLEAAGAFLATLGATGKNILFVGVKPESRSSITSTASLLKQPFVTERWIGGMLTNFTQMKVRIDKLEKMREDRTTGEFEKYTKKEQLLLTREMTRLDRYFSGVVGLKKMPEAIVIVDPKKESIALLEARKMNIPVITIGNTDCSVRGVEFPIVANDSSSSSLGFILGILKDAFEGK
ncbi:30S ribosomal protein S2 [Patescibacteria group bacterium]|nr:30S ribosomal protein S2 [Patescibacteria group bacterium]